jgi:hypothetical protein
MKYRTPVVKACEDGGGQLAVDGRTHFVVEVWEVPILRVLDDAPIVIVCVV